jgi:hypothetical protein
MMVLFCPLVNLLQIHSFEDLLLNDEIVPFPFGKMAQKPRGSTVT